MLTGAIVAVFGLAIGSFLNVCIDRLPRGQSLLRPRSHCPACKTPLAERDMVPVLSYLLLGGRCRHCSAAIPRRVFLVEAGTGLMFALLWGLYGVSIHFLLAAMIGSVLIAASIVALERRASPDRRHGSPHTSRKELHDGVRH